MLVLIALINTIVSLFYYLLVVKAMFIRQDDCIIPTFRSACSERIAMIACTLGIIFIGIASCIYTFMVDVVNDNVMMFGLLK